MGNTVDILTTLIEKANSVMGKKLTTKKRKLLKGKSFCGPERSYPVNDCAHFV